jgi:hypothetical protein
VTALGNLRYDPARRGSGNYIMPLGDEEVELYHIARSPQPSLNEDINEEEAYRQLLATRPLPPPPVASPPRRGSPFPTLISPLSDPFIQRNDMVNSSQRLSAQEGGRTLRLVPESSGKSDPIYTHVCTTDQSYSRFSRLIMPLSQYSELRHELVKPSRQKHDWWKEQCQARGLNSKVDGKIIQEAPFGEVFEFWVYWYEVWQSMIMGTVSRGVWESMAGVIGYVFLGVLQA